MAPDTAGVLTALLSLGPSPVSCQVSTEAGLTCRDACKARRGHFPQRKGVGSAGGRVLERLLWDQALCGLGFPLGLPWWLRG